MAAQIVSLLRFTQPLRDWSQQELAEFYRVESALLRSGMRIETDRGVTDDGDPWFAFCRADDGEVFIHFARIDGEYLIAGPGYEGVARGRDFTSLVRNLIERHPLVQPAGGGRAASNNVFLHPAALLIAVVATAFFKTGEARADDGEARPDPRHRAAQTAVPSAQGASVVYVDADQTLAVVASAMIALDQTGSLLSAASARALAADAHTPRVAMHTSSPATAPAESAPTLAPAAIDTAPIASHASSPLKDLGAWLSLTVILRDVAERGQASPDADLSGMADVATRRLLQAGPAAEGAPFDASSAAANEAGRPHPLLAVELLPGPLPEVEAIRLIRDSGLVDTGSIIQIAKLPTVLIDFIARGEHVAQNELLAATPNDALPVPGEPSADHAPAADGGGMAAPPPAIVQTPATEPTAPVPSAHDAAINEVVAYFIAHTEKFEIVVVSHEVVFYDSRLMSTPSAVGEVESVTFNFDDGSSISLVGGASALPEVHGLH